MERNYDDGGGGGDFVPSGRDGGLAMAALPASLATPFTKAFGVNPLQLYPVTTVFPIVDAVSSTNVPTSWPYLKVEKNNKYREH
jgi:hypothetical protein